MVALHTHISSGCHCVCSLDSPPESKGTRLCSESHYTSAHAGGRAEDEEASEDSLPLGSQNPAPLLDGARPHVGSACPGPMLLTMRPPPVCPAAQSLGTEPGINHRGTKWPLWSHQHALAFMSFGYKIRTLLTCHLTRMKQTHLFWPLRPFQPL